MLIFMRLKFADRSNMEKEKDEFFVNRENQPPICMTFPNYMKYMGIGRQTANKIVAEAEAKIYIGGRVLVNMEKVKKYLDSISE